MFFFFFFFFFFSSFVIDLFCIYLSSLGLNGGAAAQ